MTWRFVPAASLMAILLTSLSTHAALHSRLGGQAYYDDQLDITWAADANINSFATWDNQVDWVTNLFIDGVSGWRLPNMDINGDGTIANCSFASGQTACSDNEYDHLFFYGAGTTWSSGVRSGNPGPFSNVQAFNYWSSTINPPTDAWSTAFSNGGQQSADRINVFFAWAVHDGDVAGALAGDLNGDGFVGVDDLNIVLVNWNQNVTPGDLGSGDPTGEGFVGVDDLNIVLVNWNSGTPPADGGAIPEPGTAAVLSLLGLGLLRRKRLAG